MPTGYSLRLHEGNEVGQVGKFPKIPILELVARAYS